MASELSIQTGHVGLNVTDVSRSVEFYRRVFELDLLGQGSAQGRPYAFLGRDSMPVLTLWQQSEGRFAAGVPGLHHLSFQVADVGEVRRVESVVREVGAPMLYDGIAPHGEGAPSGGIFFADPDGIRLEVFATTGAEGLPAPVPGAPTCGLF
jgi:catechol 2,3-dioxygenase-like lactoylglutathione lyase family enzyme